jgi:TPR repeat protein
MPQAAIRQYEEDEHLSALDVVQQAVSKLESEEVVNVVESPNDEQNQEEPYYHYTVDTKDPDPWLIKHKGKLVAVVILLIAAVAGGLFYKNLQLNAQTKAIIAEPKLNDLYYVDFRLIKDNLRPAEKFRMAKVQYITGDVVTINFSSYFYLKEHELNEAIRYAQLRYEKFFQEKRHNYKISKLQEMVDSGAIVLARRPDGNVLDGNVVVPDSHFESNSMFIPGKKENFAGLEYLKFTKAGVQSKQAFEKFQESAEYDFAQGQVNLAQMYLTGNAVQKDLYESLAWLKKASLQSYEPAILKYAIVCEQVESCMVADFYEELVKGGVNIEFTRQTDVRATTKAFEQSLQKIEEFKNQEREDKLFKKKR